MADRPPADADAADEGRAAGSPPAMPRWVKAFGLIALGLIVLVAAVLIFGGGSGGHGPSRHGPGAMSPADDLGFLASSIGGAPDAEAARPAWTVVRS